MVLSTHLLGDVERVCDQIVVLNAGTVLASGGLNQLLAGADNELTLRIQGEPDPFLTALASRGLRTRREGTEIRVSRSPSTEATIFAAAQESHVQIRYLGPSVRSMEELFLSLVQAREGGVAP
jgi:ABC-type multidrug transport system ATPase subunit